MLAGLSHIEMFALVCAGLALDDLLGEPRRAHPLVAFGRMADWIEARLNRSTNGNAAMRRLLGALALLALVGIPAIAVALVQAHAPAWAALAMHAAALYFALGVKSLWLHVRPIAAALASGDLERARALAARIVSRDLGAASPAEVARAAVESTLENGNDAVFGALFWFALCGAPGAIAYRLVNTLDAMWGYKTERHLHFGWAAARADDAMNYVPARLTALTYALLGDTRIGFACWRTQASAWESPNAGPVMAAGAGALRLELGGAARYHGRLEQRPRLGAGMVPDAADVERALRLVLGGVAVWLAVLAGIATWRAIAGGWGGHA